VVLLFNRIGFALVLDRDRNLAIQVGQLTQAISQCVEAVFGGLENAAIGPEVDQRSIRLVVRHVTDLLDLRVGHTVGVGLLPDGSVLPDRGFELRRQGVNTRDTDAVKTAGNLVGVLVKLTPRVEGRHNHFEGAAFFGRVDIHRDTASVIPNRNRTILVNGHDDGITVPGEGFVNRVIDDFIDQVMQSSDANIADVHGGAFANSFQSFEDLNIGSSVLLLGWGFSHKNGDLCRIGTWF